MAELKTVSLEKIKVPDVRVSSVLNNEQRALIASTIKEIGLVQDIVVRDLGDGSFELVAGKSRLEELTKLGVTEREMKVISADEKLALIMNITENVARGTYEYLSVARAIRRLISLGSSWEDLEKIFPWKRRWIQFIEGLQDLPDDVQAAIESKKITPTHIQIAINLPTPVEVHDGLRTAITHGWDTGTFGIFVENRVAQIEAARKRAAELHVEIEIPVASPTELIRYKMCLTCGYKTPAEKITTQLVCEDCVKLLSYVTGQIGPPAKCMDVLFSALKLYYGQRPEIGPGPEHIREASSPT